MNKSAAGSVEPRLMQTFIPILFLGLLATSAPARSARAAKPARSQTVLVLGDSLTAGYGLKRSDAFPALLSEKAEEAGLRLKIVNAGVSGDTTAGGLRRIGPLLQQRVDALLIELGINDAFRDIPVAQIEANLQKIIDQTKGRYPQARIIIAGMQLPNYSKGDYLTRFGEMYAGLARRNQAAFVPFLLDGVAGQPGLNQRDMIHPNAAGQKILANNVWPVLESALKKNNRS